MMTKKEYLLKLLESFPVEVFPAKEDFVYLLQQNKFESTLLDALFAMFSSSVSDIHDGEIKEKFEKSAQFIQKLKGIEANDKVKDQKDIADLDSMLASI